MAAITKISTVIIGLGWIAVTANACHQLGHTLPSAQFNTALSALIVASLLDGIVWILRGPGYYRAMRLGEAIGEEKARRRTERAVAPSQRVGVTTG